VAASALEMEKKADMKHERTKKSTIGTDNFLLIMVILPG